MKTFKREYNSLILSKVTKMEAFVNDLALEQAKLLEGFITNKSKSEESKLFPVGTEGSMTSNEQLESQVTNLRMKVDQMHNE